MKTVIATGNSHKIREIGEMLGSNAADFISMKDAGIDIEIIENGNSFIENALIKARQVKKHYDGMVIADDSGLEIDYLNKEPGIKSARFMGEDTPYTVKCEAILKKLEGVEWEKRTARFVCAMAAILPNGREITVEKTFEGYIAYKYAGENGFGYDPIFFVPEKNCTSAQLSPEEKNSMSHRGKALRELKKLLSPVRLLAFEMKELSPIMASSTHEERKKTLSAIKDAIILNKELIFSANDKDLNSAKSNNINPSVVKRLKFDDSKLKSVVAGIDTLIELEDPKDKTLLKRELSDNLILKKISVPIGVIGVIFEARPDALVQIASLCIKSGNMCILKGGKETEHTNEALFNVIYEAAIASGLPEHCLARVSKHNEIDELLTCDGAVDLIIPRGSNEFVKYIMNNTSIPVLGHADGICHTYIDEYADIDTAVKVCLDAKTQYPAACNATETILVSRKIADRFLPKMKETFDAARVEITGTKEVSGIISCEIIDDNDFKNEFLDLKVAFKIVENVQEAVNHINLYGSHHTDSIITKDDENWKYFSSMVDSAGVYRNISTRFADGFRYGFGAEVGISTSKVHARGPVGLEGLMTYKYLIEGDGHIVGDFESGKNVFLFKNID